MYPVTWDSLVVELGSRGRLNFFWDPMAAGNGGAENMAATTLMRVIQECICSVFLWGNAKAMGPKLHPPYLPPSRDGASLKAGALGTEEVPYGNRGSALLEQTNGPPRPASAHGPW